MRSAFALGGSVLKISGQMPIYADVILYFIGSTRRMCWVEAVSSTCIGRVRNGSNKFDGSSHNCQGPVILIRFSVRPGPSVHLWFDTMFPTI